MQMNKTHLVKRSAQIILYLAAGYLIRQKGLSGDPLWIAAGWLLSAWVVLRVGLAVRRAVVKVRARTANGVDLASLDRLTVEAMPSWVHGYYAIEKKIYAGCWRALTRRAVPVRAGFGVAGGPNGRAIALLLLLAAGAGAAALAWSVQALALSFWPHLLVQGCVAVIGLYAAIWVLGDRRMLAETGHSIAPAALTLELGIRSAAVVALAAIAECRVPVGDFKAHCGAQGMDGSQLWRVAPGEAPNVVLVLRADTLLDTMWFGYPRKLSKRYIALYVDQPQQFARAMEAALRAYDKASMQAASA